MLLASGFALSPRVEATGLGWCTIDLQGANPERAEAELRRQVAELTRLGLPARGGMANLTDAEMRNAITYMFNKGRVPDKTAK